MEGPAEIILQPVRDGLVLVGGVVVHDGVDLPFGGYLLVDPAEERDELLMPVVVGLVADDRPVQNVQRGEQRRGPVPLVLVRHRRGLPQLHRQSLLRCYYRVKTPQKRRSRMPQSAVHQVLREVLGDSGNAFLNVGRNTPLVVP